MPRCQLIGAFRVAVAHFVAGQRAALVRPCIGPAKGRGTDRPFQHQRLGVGAAALADAPDKAGVLQTGVRLQRGRHGGNPGIHIVAAFGQGYAGVQQRLMACVQQRAQALRLVQLAQPQHRVGACRVVRL